MTRDKMMELLALLNPDSAKALTLAGITDEALESALYHEAHFHMRHRDEIGEIKLEASKADHAGRLLLVIVEKARRRIDPVKFSLDGVFLGSDGLIDAIEEAGNALLAIGNDTDVIRGVPDPAPTRPETFEEYQRRMHDMFFNGTLTAEALDVRQVEDT